ncbi:uncharacterized protein LOC106179497 [Lingula anatina]|uniref:Uncharacterized protein LOC106179497 n=1 Tax=Lingula anatina TaxID=7574 RepID=A0A1S3K7K3_LINAN|nr:uncharacterized protein LOC106179497 [Lingula anatina]|eukprot:XP_013418610.1 uncharacterized protein LOC106179497 [Lingula anatina]
MLSLCAPTITSVGSNFADLDVNQLTIHKESKFNDWKFERVYVDLGTVSNNGTDGGNSADNSKIEMEFEAIVLNNANFTSGASYWVSSGVEYGSSAWVSQATFTAVVDNAKNSSLTPKFWLTGPSQLYKGQTGLWTLDMTIFDLYTNVTVDVYAPLNTTATMSICRISIASAGDSYSCLTKAMENLSYLRSDSSTAEDPINSIGTLNLGEIVNAGFRTGNTDDSSNTIRLEIAATLMNTSDVSLGSNLSLGVSVQLDEYAIWSALMALQVVEEQLSNLTVSPAFNLETVTPEVVIGGQASFLLNMTLPSSTNQRYSVEVGLPYNDTAFMSGCRVQVKYYGFNYPCFKLPFPEYYSADSNEMYDLIFLDFGAISNTGQKSADEDNTIMVEISVTLLNTTAITHNDTLHVTVGVNYGDNTIWVGNNAIRVLETPPTYTGTKAPQLEFKNMMPDTNMYTNASVVYHLEMYLPTVTYWNPMSVEFIVPLANDSNIPLVDICRVSIIHVGNNFACLNKTQVPITLQSTTLPEINDRAVATFGMVTNVGKQDYDWTRNESVIRMEVVVDWTDKTNLTNGTEFYVDASVRYAKDKLWVARASLTYTEDEPQIASSAIGPEVNLTVESGNVYTYPGGVVEFDVSMALPPASVANYIVEAISPNSSIAVCRVEYISKGRDISPCGIKKSDYVVEDYQDDQRIDRVYQTLQGLTNVGAEPIGHDTRESYTVHTRIVAKLAENVSDTDNATEHYLAAAVSAGGRRLWLDQTPFYYLINDRPDITVTPVVNFKKQTTATSIVKGAGAVFELDIYVPPGTIGEYTVEIYAPCNDTDATMMEICDVRAVSSGHHLPCFNDSYQARNYSSNFVDGHNDQGTLWLGLLDNYKQTGDIEAPENMVRVEAVVSVPHDAPVSAGHSLCVGASLKVDNTKLWVGQIMVPVTETLIPEETLGNASLALVTPNDTASRPADDSEVQNASATMNIRERHQWQLNITLDDTTTAMTVTIRTPIIDGEAQLTLRGAWWTYFGSNIVCGHRYNFTAVNSSTHSTSQIDTMVVDLGILMNAGSSKRYEQRWRKEDPLDNVLQLTFELELTDHANNTHMSNMEFTVEATYGLQGEKSTSVNGSVTPIHHGAEVPILDLTHWISPINDSYELNPGDQIQLYARLSHFDNSTAEASNVTLVLQTMSASSVVLSSWSGREPSVTYNHGEMTFVHWDRLLFNDVNDLVFNITLDPNKVLAKGTRTVHVVIPADVSVQYEDHSTPVYDLVWQDTSSVDVEFDFFVPECFLPLGMESGAIADCQITASSSLPNQVPTDARLGSNTAWRPAFRSCNGSNDAGDYLQVALINNTKLTGLAIQTDGADASSYVTTFTLKYSYEGLVWYDVMDENTGLTKYFVVNVNGSADQEAISGWSPTPATTDDVFYVPVYPSVTGRYIRIIPVSSSNNHSALRVELYGCSAPQSSVFTINDLEECQGVNSAIKPSFQRGYLVSQIDGTIFVCTMVGVDAGVYCSRSEDAGAGWTCMDNIVSNILLQLNSTGSLYGLDRELRTYLRSDDSGDTWEAVSDEEYNAASSSNDAVHVIGVPYALDLAADTTQNLFSTSGTTYGGVLYGVSCAGVMKWASASERDAQQNDETSLASAAIALWNEH